MEEVAQTIEQALHLGTISFNGVKHQPLCRIERRPVRLGLDYYRHVPVAQVRITQASKCMPLLGGEPVSDAANPGTGDTPEGCWNTT